ncbi:hypothetical protein BSL78_04422 [Apostichopus japonicus]|uniref:RING-type domain-containing protein n=1 Tax=Stichopus japonicus TaxID=307972 RepID=A0A2G8LEF4_STIJA|nr:hypothetical protein BSL78_04422 [Apostichopus japonicus]
MPTQCCIPRCHVLSWSNRTLKVSHHTFPKDPQLFKKWTNFVRYTNRDFQPSCFSTLCSKHFADSAIVNTPYISFLEEKYDASSLRIRLKADAVPTILYAYKAEDADQTEKADTEAQISTEDNAIAIAGEEPGQVAVDEKEIKSEIKMTSARKHRRNVLHLVRLTDINAYITCFLCGGYMYNATTITECLHSFCRKCILQHFQKDNRCPTCDIVIHESIPFSFIRQDGHLQTIINKLLPSFERMEKEGEKKVLDMQQEELPPTPAPLNPTAEVVPIYNKMVSSAQISLQLDYLGISDTNVTTIISQWECDSLCDRGRGDNGSREDNGSRDRANPEMDTFSHFLKSQFTSEDIS